MTVYDVVLFLHITSAIIMFASLAVDWLAIAGLRVTWTAERGRIWIRALEVSAAFGVWARLAVLGAGIYLAVDAWSWQGWIIVGLVSWAAFVLLGEPLTGKDLREMAAGVRAEQGTLSIALLTRLHNPRMWQSVLTRVGLGAGIVFCMAVKPPAAAAAGAVTFGLLAGLAIARLTPAPDRTREPREEKTAQVRQPPDKRHHALNQ
jgi:hypothetical protein